MEKMTLLETEAGASSPTEEDAGLFETAPSDAELGVEEGALPDPAEQDSEPESETPDESAGEAEPEPDQDLQRSREEHQRVVGEISQLRAELRDLRGPGEENEPDDAEPDESEFTKLSDKEFEELLEDDPIEAIKYERKLKRFEEKRKEEDSLKAQEQAAIEGSLALMEKAVPGLFDEGSGVADTLAEFAINNDFEGEYLAVLTDPSTKVIIDDPKNPKKTITVPLGPAAAALTSFIYKAHEAIKKGKPAGGSKGSSKKKIDSSAETTISESEFAKMSEKEKAEYLGGL